jgi:RHH-type transcriptional regulator, rel operon repressor / antitoxin RelB
MNTETFSVRLDRAAKARLQKLAKSTGRSRSYLAAEAIVAFLDTHRAEA